MNILFCGSGWFPIVDSIAARLPDGMRLSTWDRSAPLCQAARDAQILLPSNARIDAEVVAAPRDLRLIQQPAAGIDNVDLTAARERGVPVCNTPGQNHVAVAEAALLLILALARRLPAARDAFAGRRIGEPLGMELEGKTLGIIGLGRSGSALAQRARALGMHVRGVGSTSPPAKLRALLADADVVSLHCPLSDRTRGLIGHEALALMKPGALLINCARGPIIDRDALDAALARGHLGGVGLDTFWMEPWDPDDPLYARPDVVALPHIAGSTREAFGRIADVVVANIARVVRGEDPHHRVA